MTTRVSVSIGDQVFVVEGGESFGSVRFVDAHELVVDIENFGDVRIGAASVRAVHDGKVVLDETSLTPEVKRAIKGAHKAETT